MAKPVTEPHSVWQGSFILFGVDLKCHVLSDGQRIIEEDSMVDLLKAMEAMGAPLEGSSAGAELTKFVKWLAEGHAARRGTDASD